MPLNDSDANSILKNALFAAMVGFASATKLVPVKNILSTDYRIEDNRDPSRPGQLIQSSDLPYFTGRVSDIHDDDLGGIGGLVRVYRPKLLLPTADVITVHNITSMFPIRSGMFHILDFDEYEKILPKDRKIFLPKEKNIEDVLPIIQSKNKAVINDLISSCAEELRNTPSAHIAERENVYRAMDDYRYLLVASVQEEFSAVRRELELFRRETNDSMRMLTETVDNYSKIIDLRKAVKKTPQRLAEKTIDETIISTGKAFAKVLTAALMG